MSNNFLPLLADRVLNRPLLILPDKLAVITEVLSGRIGLDASAPTPDASRFAGSARQGEPYKVTPQGVAVITITGSLVNRGAWVGAQSGMTSYEGIAHQLQTAARDPKVRTIILDLDSPGGEATGAFETAALVRKVNHDKPIYAFVNGMAASAAYAIASGAKAIISTESAMTGSIGVVLMHTDVSRAADRAGITPTLIFAGKHKTAGNPYQPLPKSVRADLQAEVDRYYGMFLSTVAVGRGTRLTADAAKATEARTFIGRSAQKAGLIDDTGNFEEIVGHLSKTPARTKPAGISTMIDPSIFSDDYEPAASAASSASEKATPEAVESAYQKGIAIGKEIGARAEHSRIGALLSTPMAQSDLKGAIATIFESNAVDAAASKPAASAYYSPDELAAKINAENGFNAVRVSGKADTKLSQTGTMSPADVMATVNAEARAGLL